MYLKVGPIVAYQGREKVGMPTPNRIVLYYMLQLSVVPWDAKSYC